MTQLAARVFLPRQAQSRLPAVAWSVAAAASIGVAVAIAFQPGQLRDLRQVREWLLIWSRGGNPYALYQDLDYPPGALVLLWPLQSLHGTEQVVVFVSLMIGAAALGTWLLAEWFAGRFSVELTRRERLMLIAMMLAGGTMRSALWRGQTAMFALLAGAAALRLSRSHPRLAAIALALCAFKPHVALGFALALCVTGGGTIVLGAAAIVALKTLWFAVSVHTPLDVVTGMYASNLLHLYDGPDRIRGLVSVRWAIEDLAGSYSTGTAIYAFGAAATAAILANAALRQHDPAGRARIAAALMLWALLFLPQQLYHSWMAWPALWLMMWPESGLIRSERIRAFAVSAYVLFGVIDIPRLIRAAADIETPWALIWLSYALSPLRVSLVFALLLWTIVARHGAPRDGRPIGAR